MTTNTVKHTPGKCEGCGVDRVNSGAPIWEDYCPNAACTHDRDEISRFYKASRERFARDQALRDAAPDMLKVLIELVASDEDYEGTPEDDERCQAAFTAARALISKAHGISTPEAQS